MQLLGPHLHPNTIAPSNLMIETLASNILKE